MGNSNRQSGAAKFLRFICPYFIYRQSFDKVYVIELFYPLNFYFRHSRTLRKRKLIQQLCDINSGYGALRCNYNTGGCPGSTNNCYPDGVWASAASGSNWGYRLKSGSFNLTFNNNLYATGVRCVLGFEFSR